VSYQFHPAAEAEHLEAVAYYESKQPGLGASYLTEFETAMEQVCAAPYRYPIERQPDIRRIRLKQFPYMILYREVNGMVQVLAVAHYRRRPEYWLGRL
jgi:toxin ParE1/3/4